MVLAEPIRITQQIVSIFEFLNIRYFIGGSLASSLHGIPRATQDVDVVADIKKENIPQLVKAFITDFYIDADMISSAIQRHSSFNIIHCPLRRNACRINNIRAKVPGPQKAFDYSKKKFFPTFFLKTLNL